MSQSEEKIGFISHLTELRKRLIHCLIFLFSLFAVCYFFSEYILKHHIIEDIKH